MDQNTYITLTPLPLCLRSDRPSFTSDNVHFRLKKDSLVRTTSEPCNYEHVRLYLHARHTPANLHSQRLHKHRAQCGKLVWLCLYQDGEITHTGLTSISTYKPHMMHYGSFTWKIVCASLSSGLEKVNIKQAVPHSDPLESSSNDWQDSEREADMMCQGAVKTFRNLCGLSITIKVIV